MFLTQQHNPHFGAKTIASLDTHQERGTSLQRVTEKSATWMHWHSFNFGNLCIILYSALTRPKILCWYGINLSICLSTQRCEKAPLKCFTKWCSSYWRHQSSTFLLLITSIGFFLQRSYQNFSITTVWFHMIASKQPKTSTQIHSHSPTPDLNFYFSFS